MGNYFTTNQHRCAQIKLMKELCDENVHLEHLGYVFAFDITQHLNEPLKVSMRWTDP